MIRVWVISVEYMAVRWVLTSVMLQIMMKSHVVWARFARERVGLRLEDSMKGEDDKNWSGDYEHEGCKRLGLSNDTVRHHDITYIIVSTE